MSESTDEYWMAMALELAQDAGRAGEVPVGAVLVRDDKVLGRGRNAVIAQSDPTAHAEIAALRQAALACGNYRLPGSSLYVTLEPCTMCAGALVHARVARLIYGAQEPKSGAVVSTSRVLDNPALNHQIAVVGGVCASQAGDLLRRFFAERRAARSAAPTSATKGVSNTDSPGGQCWNE